MLPREVAERIEWGFKFNPKPTCVSFFPKSQFSRAEAWYKTKALIKGEDRNPWRKMHTEHFWAWYIPEKKDGEQAT
jgi:hypothetical protein